jgi:hypothetical protein
LGGIAVLGLVRWKFFDEKKKKELGIPLEKLRILLEKADSTL